MEVEGERWNEREKKGRRKGEEMANANFSQVYYIMAYYYYYN
jgi:hypothetical protein